MLLFCKACITQAKCRLLDKGHLQVGKSPVTKWITTAIHIMNIESCLYGSLFNDYYDLPLFPITEYMQNFEV